MEFKKPTNRPACAVHTIPDPEQLGICSHGEVDGTLEVRCETPNYPYFDVEIVTCDPPDAIRWERLDRISGAIDKPVVIHLDKEGDFEYLVYHYHKGDPMREEPLKPPSGPFACGVHPCPACKGVI
jgi:hypothetical protein